MMFYLSVGVIVAALAACGVAVWRLRAENLAAYEKFCRNRWVGMVFGWAALLLCVPHALVVSPDFLKGFLVPIALAAPVLCFFYLEYFAARSVAGLAILLAYEVIHLGFNHHLPASPALTVAALAVGCAGIWVSGRPCSLRDWFRMGARHRNFSRVAATGLLLFAAGLLAAAFGVGGSSNV